MLSKITYSRGSHVVQQSTAIQHLYDFGNQAHVDDGLHPNMVAGSHTAEEPKLLT